jgi:hypothetical protein
MNGIPLSPFALTAIVCGVIGAILFIAGIVALFRARLGRFTVRTLVGVVLLLLGAVAGAIALGTQGYRALTREEVAARLDVRPAGPQRFVARIHMSDGSTRSFDLAGDEIYVDAHILKWKPLANVVGLHTAYELDRVAGRYQALEQERTGARTVYSLKQEKPVDLFGLRQRYAFLAPLFDAEYGSATFVPVTAPAQLEVRVSTTGLLMRDVQK